MKTPPPTGFLEEAPGVKSSTRLMSAIALLAGIGIGAAGIFTGTATHGLPEWLVTLAITGKVGGKVAEVWQKKTA